MSKRADDADYFFPNLDWRRREVWNI